MPWKDQLHIPSEHPWNHEPSLEALINTFFTPNELFFVRNHNPVPDLTAEDWELEIVGDEKSGLCSRTFTLAGMISKENENRSIYTWMIYEWHE
jgi:sulfite oxidase